MVSRQFQKSDINYAELREALTATCDSIEQQYLIEEPKFGLHLRDFLDNFEHAT